MANKLVPPNLEPVDESLQSARPDLRTSPKRTEPRVDQLLTPGFVTEAPLVERVEPDDILEAITFEVPRRVKRALLNEVAARRGDPDRRSVASMKSVILEALATHGFGELIRQSDIQVQAGIFMKRQSAQLKRR
jgi:hypothetical protein